MKIEEKIYGMILFLIILVIYFLRGLECVVLYRIVYCIDNYIYGNFFYVDFSVCRFLNSMIILFREMNLVYCCII